MDTNSLVATFIDGKNPACYIYSMPTVFVDGKYRFYFFSREENRKHVHVSSPDGEVKIWLEPEIAVAKIVNISNAEVAKILGIVQAREEEINDHWNKHFAK